MDKIDFTLAIMYLSDPSIPMLAAFVSGLFALLGGFAGAWLARRTEYEKWLRQERSTAFAEFLRQLHAAHLGATDLLYDHGLSAEGRAMKITELFIGLNSQEGIVRLYLKPRDRENFSDLKKQFGLLYAPETDQKTRVKKVDGLLSDIQSIFEGTIHDDS